VTNGALQALGETLREAREARALSLEEVEAQTRIRAKFLEALEHGDLSVLPSPAHAKGFLRNYAQFLHLDANETIARFAEATGTGMVPITGPTLRASAPLAEQRAVQPQETLASAAPAAPAPEDAEVERKTAGKGSRRVPKSPAKRRATYVGPEQRSGPAVPLKMQQGQQQVQQQVRAERAHGPAARILRSNLFAAAILLVGLVAVGAWALTSLSTISGDALVPAEQNNDLLEQLGDNPTPVPSPTFRPTSTPAVEAQQPITDRVVLSISVQQPSWTRVVVDGETVFEGQAAPGDVLRYEGQEEVFIRTGNGAGLVVTYNGLEIGPLGERGEIVERFFTVEGQVTPTPTPTVTPTNTSVPTATPRMSPTPTLTPTP
jgi:transcriptional regulator with XRE-family HTH domain